MWMSVNSRVQNLLSRESGASFIETSLAIAFVAIIAMGATKAVGSQVSTSFDSINQEIAAGGSSSTINPKTILVM